MRGFFDKTNVIQQVSYRSEKGIHSCVSCGLYREVLHPRIEPYGEFEKKVMIIGEAPGEEEDKRGKPWQGQAGRTLKLELCRIGVNLFKDCISLNAINCRPVDKNGGNRPPTEYEISCCRLKVISAIKRYKPKVIILLGNAPLSSVIGHKWRRSLGGITKWAGWAIPDRDFQAWVCPTFHPSFIMRQEEENETRIIWRSHLEQAFSKAEEPFPDYPDEEDCVEVTNDTEGVLKGLIKQQPEFLAFDIEATGLKPYNKDVHEIVCISFCAEHDKAYCVPAPKTEKEICLLKELLEHPKIGKIAANMKYEDTWMNVIYGISPNPWKFDTVLGAHILDNRQGITSLKFQAYVHFGVVGYDEFVSPYLKSSSSYEPNEVKRLVQDPESFRQLMIYCGMDSLLTYRLAELQMKELSML